MAAAPARSRSLPRTPSMDQSDRAVAGGPFSAGSAHHSRSGRRGSDGSSPPTPYTVDSSDASSFSYPSMEKPAHPSVHAQLAMLIDDPSPPHGPRTRPNLFRAMTLGANAKPAGETGHTCAGTHAACAAAAPDGEPSGRPSATPSDKPFRAREQRQSMPLHLAANSVRQIHAASHLRIQPSEAAERAASEIPARRTRPAAVSSIELAAAGRILLGGRGLNLKGVETQVSACTHACAHRTHRATCYDRNTLI